MPVGHLLDFLPGRGEGETVGSAETGSEGAAGTPPVNAGEMKLEVVVVPVSDVDRAKHFYEGLGWRLDADLAVDDGYRVVQLTPPGSACSIIFGEGVTTAPPGSSEGLQLSVYDIDAARRLQRSGWQRLAAARDQDPASGSVRSGMATAYESVDDLAAALRRAAEAHGKHEERTGEEDPNWPDWYALYMVRERGGEELPS
jgi:catechol 2,3-dioxygenase-like lactoylglutathione lyase family enzyme